MAISIAAIISFFFPSVPIELKSLRQNYKVYNPTRRAGTRGEREGNERKEKSERTKGVQGLQVAFLDIVKNKETLQWAVWYMLVMACNDMALNYATNLFYAVDSKVG